MKLSYKFASLCLAGAITLTSCGDFGDINVDPNNPSEAPTSTLLTSAQGSIPSVVSATTGALYVEHLSETQYTDASRYGTAQFDFNGWYTGPLINLQTIINLNTDEATRDGVAGDGSNANQIAVARIMKAYYFGFMTDRWGSLPYSEALQGSENFSPAYDDQQTIYTSLITELEEAAAQIELSGQGVSGDVLFGGNMDSWRRFANTLRANMAMRMSDVSAAAAQSAFEDAVSDGLIESDVFYAHLANANYQNFWYGRFITRTDFAVSEAMVDLLKGYDDPRLPAYATPALSLASGDIMDESMFVGMPYGIEAAGDIPNTAVSFITANVIYTQDAPSYVFTSAQVEFLLAEAAVKGWSVPGTAQEHYEAGISASMSQWGVLDAGTYSFPDVAATGGAAGATMALTDFATYIAQAGVAYDAANAMDQIAEQKWIALYLQGYEAWSEWRRLDAPNLAGSPEPLNNSGLIPVRHGYPTSEADLNSANYEAAVAAQGADGLDTRLWWDVN